MIIPSIDLIGGKAVQLKQGREIVLEREHPEDLAKEFARFGELAVIDLDAALGEGGNEEVIGKICSLAECRVGGGIRSVEKAERILSFGAEKLIIGTKALSGEQVNHGFLQKICAAAGRERIIIALDTVDGQVVTKGWRHKTGISWDSVVKELEPYASEFLFTFVEKEGMMRGTNSEALKRMKNTTGRPVTAAGGVCSLDEIAVLSKTGVNIQLGMALYTGKISLPDAFVASLDWEKGLLPTIAVDESSQVLMLAYSDKTSLTKTFRTGNAWYFSRSRGKLWMKGESSGNTQGFVKVRSDCDGDAVLMTVKPAGPACHRGSYSCFGTKHFSLGELYGVILDRLENPVPGSYTSKLTGQQLADKIREEAEELIEAERTEDVVWEAADLMYFLTVLLAKKGIPYQNVLNELKRRRRAGRCMSEKEGGIGS